MYKAIIAVSAKIFKEEDGKMIQSLKNSPAFHKTFAVTGDTEDECQSNLDNFLKQLSKDNPKESK